MKLSFQNIGKVAKADIEIDAITVITGENDTGKSTVGKLMYGLYTALHELTPRYLLQHKFESLYDDVNWVIESIGGTNIGKEAARDILELTNYVFSVFNEVSITVAQDEVDLITEKENKLDSSIKELIKKISIIDDINVTENKKARMKIVLEDMLEKSNKRSSNEDTKRLLIENILLEEFSNSLTTEINTKNADIHFTEDKENYLELKFSNNKIIKGEICIIKNRNFSQVFYIENPFILDTLNGPGFLAYRTRGGYNHIDRLVNLLFIKGEKNFFEEAMKEDAITNILSSVLDGKIIKSPSGYKYHSQALAEPIPIKNISAGMKSFALLQLLIDLGHLNKRSEMLIVDEPEIHLHPDWQLKYAELIVLLAKEYQLRVLITSHSFNFINAIELYSQKHKIDEGVNFYKTNSLENGMTEIINVTEDLESLYADMIGPIEIFEKMEEELDGR